MSHKLDLMLEEFFPHPVEYVWAALTERTALDEWLMPSEFEAVEGHDFTFRANPEGTWRGWTQCRVLEIDAPHRMVWQWESAEIPEPTRVVFELRSTEGGTRLTLHHYGHTTDDDALSVSQGWPIKLGHLGQWLDRHSELHHREGSDG